MSQTPFGFGVPEEPEDGESGQNKRDGESGRSGQSGPGGRSGGQSGEESGGAAGRGPTNPMEAMFGSLGMGGGPTPGPQELGAAFQQLGEMLSHDGGPVNWELARNVARQTVTQAGTDASVVPRQREQVQEAVRLAELWLDGVTALPSGASSAVAWSRAEWVEATLPVWQQLVDPVAEQVGSAMGQVLPQEMQAMAGPLLGMMRSMGGAMFGTQIGQAVGTLAGEVVGATDIGLPLGPAGQAALLPGNVETFGEGLGVPQDEVRYYLALREAAHHRLFEHVPWLRSHLLGAVEGYARGIRVDTERLEDMVGQLDPSRPEEIQEKLQQGLFQPQDTPEQKAALARLETALALVEGWVDAVVHAAAAPHLPSAGALRETLRRSRASGGPAEQTFASLVGLQLRPRRLRDASRLWASLADARGQEGRDALWAHPDLLPTADDLDDPDGFVHREQPDFSELDRLLGKAAASREAGDGSTDDGGAAGASDGDGSDGSGGSGGSDGSDGSGGSGCSDGSGGSDGSGRAE